MAYITTQRVGFGAGHRRSRTHEWTNKNSTRKSPHWCPRFSEFPTAWKFSKCWLVGAHDVCMMFADVWEQFMIVDHDGVSSDISSFFHPFRCDHSDRVNTWCPRHNAEPHQHSAETEPRWWHSAAMVGALGLGDSRGTTVFRGSPCLLDHRYFRWFEAHWIPQAITVKNLMIGAWKWEIQLLMRPSSPAIESCSNIWNLSMTTPELTLLLMSCWERNAQDRNCMKLHEIALNYPSADQTLVAMGLGIGIATGKTRWLHCQAIAIYLGQDNLCWFVTPVWLLRTTLLTWLDIRIFPTRFRSQ